MGVSTPTPGGADAFRALLSRYFRCNDIFFFTKKQSFELETSTRRKGASIMKMQGELDL